MKVLLTSRHVELTTKIKDHITTKGNTLNNYFDGINKLEVIIDKVGKLDFKVSLNAQTKFKTLTTQTKEKEILTAFDSAYAKMERSLIKLKDKIKN